MEAKAYKVTNVRRDPWSDEDAVSETWAYYIRSDSMSPAEQEVVRESNLRAKHSGYELKREAIGAAKIDAEDIRRAALVRAVEV